MWDTLYQNCRRFEKYLVFVVRAFCCVLCPKEIETSFSLFDFPMWPKSPTPLRPAPPITEPLELYTIYLNWPWSKGILMHLLLVYIMYSSFQHIFTVLPLYLYRSYINFSQTLSYMTLYLFPGLDVDILYIFKCAFFRQLF